MTDNHKIKLNSFFLKGEIKKFNDTYIVKDNTTLNNLVVVVHYYIVIKVLVDIIIKDKKKFIFS